MSTVRLCIFAKVPEPGLVKRRLAAAIGLQAACSAHTELVRDTLTRLAAVPGMTSELWLDRIPNEAAQRWLEEFPVPLRRQHGDDLGTRMCAALRSSLDVADRALLVGSDCPDVDGGYVRLAAQRLSSADVVLGPAEDGGYGLVGVRRRALTELSSLFAGITWGTDTVLDETLALAHAAGLTVALLDTIWDVDDVAGWQRYLALGRSV